jgi:hemolysin III
MEGPEVSKDGSSRVTDEKVNSASHLAAAIFSLMGSVLLIVLSSVEAKVWHIVSFSIFGTSLTLLFVASTLHHYVNATPRIEKVLRTIDYLAIYPLIAGSMTPMCLVVARGPFGWSLFGVSWTVAAMGMVLRALHPALPKWVSLTFYAALGCLGAVVAWPVYQATSWHGAGLVVLGGILYSSGSVIFIVERPNPLPGRFGFHEIWHLLVIAGAALIYAFMYLYVLPLP